MDGFEVHTLDRNLSGASGRAIGCQGQPDLTKVLDNIFGLVSPHDVVELGADSQMKGKTLT